jgi:large subunit ribosomal protein L15
VLARGDISKKLTVQAHKFSGRAAEKIAAAGGAAEVLATKKNDADEAKK